MKIQTKSSAQNIVKCLLITSVVFFHASMFLVANPAEVMSQFNILLTLFPFLMMVFFFYAGYNYTPGKRTIGQNIKRRTFQLLIPMVITFAVSIGVIFAIKLPTSRSGD
jgi:fucose 4-O-acetylase-like acetyltransferase